MEEDYNVKSNIDEKYLLYYSAKLEEKYIEKVQKLLNNNQINYEEIKVVVSEEYLDVESIMVELKKESILNKDEHIVFIEETTELISNNLLINREKLIINEN